MAFKQQQKHAKNHARAQLQFSRLDFALCAIVFLLALFAYSQFFGIRLLDFDAVQNVLSHSKPGIGEIIKIFTGPEQHYNSSTIMYRPIESLIWWVFFQAWNLNFVPYHLFVFFLHALNSALVFLLARKLLFGRASSFAAAAVFALHPLQVQAVVFVSRLPELLVAFSLLSSLFFFAEYLERKKARFFLAALFFCVLGLFSKESGAFIPFVLFFFALVFSSERNLARKAFFAAKSSALFFAALLVYILAMLFALGRLSSYSLNQPLQGSVVLLLVLKYLLYPVNFLQTSFFSSAFVALQKEPLNAFVLAVFLLCSAVIFFVLLKRKSKTMLFLFSWFFASLLAFLAYGDFLWWYSYSLIIPLALLCSAALHESANALAKQSALLKKASALVLFAAVCLLFFSLVVFSPLFVKYSAPAVASNASQEFFNSVSSAVAVLPNNSLLLLANTPEYLSMRDNGLDYAINIANESSVQAFLEWRFPGKNFSAFSVSSMALFGAMEEIKLKKQNFDNCTVVVENQNLAASTIYVPVRSRPYNGETSGIVAEPDYANNAETITLRFQKKNFGNAFLLWFDGKSVKTMPVSTLCR